MAVATFTIGRMSPTAVIRSLVAINGVRIGELEERMREGNTEGVTCFLGNEEPLLDLMARDNDTILAADTTHQQTAEHLRHFIGLVESAETVKGLEHEYQGRAYKVFKQEFLGGLESPLDDGLTSSSWYALLRVDAGRVIFFTDLHPELADRYGIYMGGKEIILGQEWASRQVDIRRGWHRRYLDMTGQGETYSEDEFLASLVKDAEARGDGALFFLAAPDQYRQVVARIATAERPFKESFTPDEIIYAAIRFNEFWIASYRLNPASVLEMLA